MYKRFIHLFVLSCRRATFLTEKKLHSSLSLVEKLQLQTHLSLCPYCRAYTDKAILLDKLMSNKLASEADKNHFSEREVEGLKKRVKTALKMQENT